VKAYGGKAFFGRPKRAVFLAHLETKCLVVVQARVHSIHYLLRIAKVERLAHAKLLVVGASNVHPYSEQEERAFGANARVPFLL
jgi:hypothetical protein